MGATARNVDFTKVKDGGQFNKARIPAGDYLATIIQVEDAVAKDDVAQYLFTIKINNRPSASFPYYCKLQENQLWKLRNLFIAAGKVVPKSKVKVDPNTLLKKQIGVTIGDTEYDGKEQSQIDGVFPASELDESNRVEDIVDDEDEDDEDDSLNDLDEAPPAKAKKKAAPVVEDEEEDDDELEEDDEEEEANPYAALDRTELKNRIRKLKPGYDIYKSTTDDELREVLAKLDSSDDEVEDDEEEEEPAPRRVAKAKTKVKASEVTDEELEELNIDDL